MTRLTCAWRQSGCADGEYTVRAKGFLAASLHWADENGPLPDWTPIAWIPLDMTGNGSFCFGGGRAIPAQATHVAARLVSPDFARTETELCDIPPQQRSRPAFGGARLGLLSDLHVTVKIGHARRAMRLLSGLDCVLVAGDWTNDGQSEQFARAWQCMEETLENVPVLAVAGNHDYPLHPLPAVAEGIDSYLALQARLLERAQRLGVSCHADESGAWRAEAAGVPIMGLNAVSHFRRFVFPRAEQLTWLAAQLENTAGQRKIVVCHAPLLAHNPVRRAGEAPYLSRDGQLQAILDAHRGVLFASGHTHISLNEPDGCAEYDAARGNIYLNDASVTPTTKRTPETLSGDEWTDGTVVYLTLREEETEISARSIVTGRWMARGYYRWREWDTLARTLRK